MTGSSETGSMEEDGVARGVEPFVARARAGMGTGNNSTGGARAGSNAGGGANLKQVMYKGFGAAQGIFERNRMLIQEISQNQETSDADSKLTHNVALIREINTNVARVVDLYGDLSGRFARALAVKKAADAAAAGHKGGPKRPHSAGTPGSSSNNSD